MLKIIFSLLFHRRLRTVSFKSAEEQKTDDYAEFNSGLLRTRCRKLRTECSVRYAPGWDLVHVDGGCLTIGGWSRQLRAEDSGHGPEVVGGEAATVRGGRPRRRELCHNSIPPWPWLPRGDS